MELLLSARQLVAQDPQKITADLIAEYVQQIDGSPATIRTYKACVNRFCAWLAERELTADYETIVIYKRHLGESMRAKAVNTHLAAIKDLFRFLERKGIKNEARNVKKEKIAGGFVRDPLTAEQVRQILESIDRSTQNGAREYALFKLLVQTGLRECEAVRADLDDIQTKGNRTVLYIQGKGESEKNNYVVLYPSVMEALQHYFKMRGAKPGEPLFISTSNHNRGERITTRTVQRIVKSLYERNGIISRNITTHSTRHTAVTLSILNGADIQQAQAMARHKNINTTMLYYHSINRLEDNAEARLEQLFS